MQALIYLFFPRNIPYLNVNIGMQYHIALKRFLISKLRDSLWGVSYMLIFMDTKKAEGDKFPTWWPTLVFGFIYLCGYSGIIVGSFFMATALFFLEYISRKNDTLFFSCIGFLVLGIYHGWIFNWFLISGIIPLCFIYIVCRKLSKKTT